MLIQDPVESGRIDYAEIIKQYAWAIEKNRLCVLSPDSDGFICGLLVTNFLNWRVVGFYDGKVLITQSGVNINDCSFLDIEINRAGVGSIGNHLVEYNRSIPINNFNFQGCIQPNILRKFDGKNAFQRKYPFGTIHLLLGILQYGEIIDILPDSAISPLLFVDGVGNNLFGYPENCLDWIDYLKINQDSHILHKFFCENDLNFYEVMGYLKEFFKVRDEFNATGYFDGTELIRGGNNKRTGHKIKISNSRGEPINLVKKGVSFDLHPIEANRVQGFITHIATMMGWRYLAENWNWANFNLQVFKKGMLSSDSENPDFRLNNKTITALFEKNPLSLAMTATNRIEYSIE